jgi:uncharacterized FlaG/YvyC family protein
MNTSDLSSTAIPELVPMTGISSPRMTATRTVGQVEADRAGTAEATPDVEISIANIMVRQHTMFHVDPETNRLQVSVVDDSGKLVRLIPPDSVAQMLQAMSAYPGRP